ncbi:MAG: methylmalonyl-CoA mutase family protein [Chloroflexi bacterium]|nr:methylmalonyl-CoA mutase family protein [Chloroflexota bacterium]
MPLREQRFETMSGLPLDDVYVPNGVPNLGQPGEYPFTRGIHADMYRGRRWTMRQYAGFGSAEETNNRFKYLLQAGQTGLSVAFDLPTQSGHDSDSPFSEGEVGKVGVAIDSVEDMQVLLADIPLDQVSTSMTINAPAAVLLAMYMVTAERHGVTPAQLSGTIQNDVLKEYIARGLYIYPPAATMRLTTDVFAYCAREIPRWNTISISGYHIREAGATAVQEVAFTLANAIAYVESALSAGLEVDSFAPRLAFFWNAQMDFLEEIAKYRAARRMWAQIMRERFKAQKPASMMMRFHTQTAGASLTAQQPLNNVVRTAIEAMAAVLGGTQSLHTNSFDEALALPTERAARIALRTQQIIAEESGAANTVDPLGGSYAIEALTDELEQRAWAYLERIDQMGGAVEAIQQGFQQSEIMHAAYDFQQRLESGERQLVGVNCYVMEEGERPELLRVDSNLADRQIERLKDLRNRRDGSAVSQALDSLRQAAEGTANLMPPIVECVRASASLGEICDTLRGVFGEYQPPSII